MADNQPFGIEKVVSVHVGARTPQLSLYVGREKVALRGKVQTSTNKRIEVIDLLEAGKPREKQAHDPTALAKFKQAAGKLVHEDKPFCTRLHSRSSSIFQWGIA